MKKGYYVHFNARISSGVDKKISMQMEELSKRYDIEEVNIAPRKRNIVSRVLGLWPTASVARSYEEALDKIKDPDFVYVRRTTCDRKYLDFFRKIKEKYPRCKVVVEIFTYPYDRDDFAKWDAWPFWIKEKMYRMKLQRYVDRFVTYSDDDEIFGIKTIIAMNGFDVDSVRQVSGSYSEDRLNLVGVAVLQRHHGYERIIEGMKEYYSRDDRGIDVFLTVVGDGPEKKYYEKLTDNYGLRDHITFLPPKYGEELEEVYETADIALVSFGMYKLGIYEKLSALKSRECLAKGLLMASGCRIDVIDDDYPYAFFAPNDETPVDIGEMVGFFEKVKQMGNKEEISGRIRRFAYENVSMEKAMMPVVEYLENKE